MRLLLPAAVMLAALAAAPVANGGLAATLEAFPDPAPESVCEINMLPVFPGFEPSCTFQCPFGGLAVNAKGENVRVTGACGGSSVSCSVAIGVGQGVPPMPLCGNLGGSGVGTGTCRVTPRFPAGFVWRALCGDLGPG